MPAGHKKPGLPRQQCLVSLFGHCLIWPLGKLRMKAANLNTCLQCKSRQDLMNFGTFSFHLGLKSCLLLIFPGINSSPHLYLTWAAIWLPINSFTKGECVAPPNMGVRPPNGHFPAFSVACPALFCPVLPVLPLTSLAYLTPLFPTSPFSTESAQPQQPSWKPKAPPCVTRT